MADPILHVFKSIYLLSFVFQYKRSPDDSQVRGPFNSNRLSRYVELVLVADNREYKANGEDLEVVHQQMKDVANIINSVSSETYNNLDLHYLLYS